MEQGALDATCEELQGVADELAALAAEEEDRAPDGDSARRILALRERICSYTPVGTTVAVIHSSKTTSSNPLVFEDENLHDGHKAGALFVSEAGKLQRTKSVAMMATMTEGKEKLPPGLLSATLLFLGGPGKQSPTQAMLWAFAMFIGGISIVVMSGSYIRHYDDPGDALETAAQVVYCGGSLLVLLISLSAYHLWTLSGFHDRELVFEKESKGARRADKESLTRMLKRLGHGDLSEEDVAALMPTEAADVTVEEFLKIVDGLEVEGSEEKLPFLNSLLAMKVSKETAGRIQLLRRKGWVLNGAMMLLSLSASTTLVAACWEEKSCPLQIKLAFFLNLIFSPIFVLGAFRAIYVLPTCLCECLGNRAAEIEATINLPAWPRTSGDYDMLAAMINRFQHRTKKLSNALQLAAVVLPVLFATIMGGLCLILALGDRPNEFEHATFNRVFSKFRMGICAMLFLFSGVLSLNTPARLNSKCEGIASAINSNRIKMESGEAVSNFHHS